MFLKRGPNCVKTSPSRSKILPWAPHADLHLVLPEIPSFPPIYWSIHDTPILPPRQDKSPHFWTCITIKRLPPVFLMNPQPLCPTLENRTTVPWASSTHQSIYELRQEDESIFLFETNTNSEPVNLIGKFTIPTW